ncbi:MAG: esterase-like activity of phytase family protein [Erythrobacter sp.]|jgi:hypothetical protein|nr:esterase-like activity of phytase family protein [Erythrobacter sp.]
MRRLLLVALIALGVAPGTWLRSAPSDEPPVRFTIHQVAGPRASEHPAWRREGVWHYRSGHKWFGGFSALLAPGGEGGGTLRAFSDRGFRFAFTEPTRAGPPTARAARQLELDPYFNGLWDIESATLDPATGRYWLGYENRHTIQRYTPDDMPDRFRDLQNEVDWGANSGAEALVRLANGRFVLLPEGESYGLIYPRDPVLGDPPRRFAFATPREGYDPVDAAQLPDGRLLVLMRALRAGIPSFASLLAIGEVPEGDDPAGFAPSIALDLAGIVPFENYEGLALRRLGDERVAVWLIADDNFSVLQRTLLAKLVFDPARSPATRTKERPREEPRTTF